MTGPPVSACVLPGRFQPFHHGHAAVLDHALSLYERVIVAVSNAHLSHLPNDPFTGGERYEMIDAFCRESAVSDRVAIIPVAVDDAPTTWVATIRAICPPFQEVYTRSPLTQTHFAYWGIPTSAQLLAGHLISGSEVRRAIAQGTDWLPLVPPAVADTIIRIDGHTRLQAMAQGSNYRRDSVPTPNQNKE